MWRDSLLKDQNLVLKVMEFTKGYDEISISDVIPDSPLQMRIASRHILRKHDQDAWSFLPVGLQGIRCDQCDTLSEKANCHTLAGDIHFALEQYELAFSEYANATELTPTDANLRLKFIRRLRETGRSKAALLQARIGRVMIPEDPRFDQWIKQMAEKDLEELRQGTPRKPASSIPNRI